MTLDAGSGSAEQYYENTTSTGATKRKRRAKRRPRAAPEAIDAMIDLMYSGAYDGNDKRLADRFGLHHQVPGKIRACTYGPMSQKQRTHVVELQRRHNNPAAPTVHTADAPATRPTTHRFLVRHEGTVNVNLNVRMFYAPQT